MGCGLAYSPSLQPPASSLRPLSDRLKPFGIGPDNHVADVGVEREGRQPLAGPLGTLHQGAHLSNGSGGQGHEVRRGEAVPFGQAGRVDGRLEIVGQTGSLGTNERLQSVRTMEDVAQLIHYEDLGEMLAKFEHAAATLTPLEVEEFFGILRRMREQGKTVIIITHKLSEVLAISDEVTVMRDGKVVGRVQTKDTNAAELARLMVGREVLLRVEKSDPDVGRAKLEVNKLSVVDIKGVKRVNEVTFEVRTGEIVGIAGVEGNGQTELIEALAGLVDLARITGEINFEGRNINAMSARVRRELGIAHIPEDRHRRGLLLDFSLAENSILGVHYRPPVAAWAGGVFLDENAIQRRAGEIIREFDVRPTNAALPARALSGGNQQKLIIGREYHVDPKLLLVSQPTRGVDIGAIEFIHRQLVGLRDAGCAILLVSAELEEVTSLSDRILIIHEGRIAGEVDPKVATLEEIGLLMTRGH